MPRTLLLAWFLGASFFGASSMFGQPPVYSVRTVAGYNANGDGALAINALVPFPSDVAIDQAGTVYISELGGPIRRITPDGIIGTLGNVNGAQGLAPDNAGNLYVASGCVVSRLNISSGAVATVAGNGNCTGSPDGPALSTSLNLVYSVAFDLQGRLLITEQGGHRIRRLDLTAQTLTTIAGTGNAGATSGDGGPAKLADIGSPSVLSLDSKGNVFFTDSGNCVVRRIDAASGNISTVAGVAGSCSSGGDGGAASAATLANPRGILATPAGDQIYVGEPFGSNRIRLINLGTNKISTIAGNGISGLSGDGGPATQATIGWPWGFALDKAGDLLVADYLASRIRSIDAAQKIHTFAGAASDGGDQGPAVAASLSQPSATAPDGKGGFFIDDFGNRKIRQVVPPGVIQTIAGTTFFAGSTGNGGLAVNAGMSQSYGMTADSAGNVYFTESSGDTRMISGGIISAVGPGNLNFPGPIAVDPSRQFLYVTEFSGARVVKINISNGTATTFAGIGAPGQGATSGYNGDGPAAARMLSNPTSVAVDGSGRVYILDGGNFLVRRVDPSTGQMTTVAGNQTNASTGDGGPALSASIGNLSGMAVDANGSIFIAQGTKIRRVDAISGNIATIAGTDATGFAGDGGPALSAQFSNAGGMSVDAQGNVYVEDQGNRIRELSPVTANPRIDAAIVASNFGGGVSIAPGTWLEIYGENLSSTTRTWQTSDFQGTQAPNTLDHVQVLFGGKPGYIDVISLGQINAQVPDGVGTGNVSIQVVNPVGSSDPVAASSADRAPALLAPPSLTANGRFYAESLFLDGTLVGAAGLIPGVPSRPAKATDTIILYGIGFGAVSPVIPAGTIATQASALPNVVVQIGGVSGTIVYAGQAGNFVGLDELYVTIPSGIPPGDALLTVSVNGVPMKQTLFLTVQ